MLSNFNASELAMIERDWHLNVSCWQQECGQGCEETDELSVVCRGPWRAAFSWLSHLFRSAPKEEEAVVEQPPAEDEEGKEEIAAEEQEEKVSLEDWPA